LRKHGARQRIDGAKFSAAPVCSFHRQVKGIAINAHAPAAAKAKRSPPKLATSPQTALPNVMAPK
jgi:hypothetical protein